MSLSLSLSLSFHRHPSGHPMAQSPYLLFVCLISSLSRLLCCLLCCCCCNIITHTLCIYIYAYLYIYICIHINYLYIYMYTHIHPSMQWVAAMARALKKRNRPLAWITGCRLAVMGHWEQSCWHFFHPAQSAGLIACDKWKGCPWEKSL